MATEKRGDASSSDVDSQDLHLQAKIRSLRMIDGARTGLTVLALAMGITTLGVSAHTLAVYDSTHVSHDFLLPLWPEEFNLKPTVALVAGSAIVLVSNIVAVLFSRVQLFRNRTTAHTSVTFVAPFVGLVAAVIAVVYFYVVNASTTEDTLLSWTCRWKDVSMSQQPHFTTLCKESWAGLYLAILLIPVESIIFCVAAWQLKVERHMSAYARARKGSPVIS